MLIIQYGFTLDCRYYIRRIYKLYKHSLVPRLMIMVYYGWFKVLIIKPLKCKSKIITGPRFDASRITKIFQLSANYGCKTLRVLIHLDARASPLDGLGVNHFSPFSSTLGSWLLQHYDFLSQNLQRKVEILDINLVELPKSQPAYLGVSHSATHDNCGFKLLYGEFYFVEVSDRYYVFFG